MSIFERDKIVALPSLLHIKIIFFILFYGKFLYLKGASVLKPTNEERALVLGSYIAENGATVRDAARKYGISKSTVHKDVTKPKGGSPP